MAEYKNYELVGGAPFEGMRKRLDNLKETAKTRYDEGPGYFRVLAKDVKLLLGLVRAMMKTQLMIGSDTESVVRPGQSILHSELTDIESQKRLKVIEKKIETLSREINDPNIGEEEKAKKIGEYDFMASSWEAEYNNLHAYHEKEMEKEIKKKTRGEKAREKNDSIYSGDFVLSGDEGAKKGDAVTIASGAHAGTRGTVVRSDKKNALVLLQGEAEPRAFRPDELAPKLRKDMEFETSTFKSSGPKKQGTVRVEKEMKDFFEKIITGKHSKMFKSGMEKSQLVDYLLTGVIDPEFVGNFSSGQPLDRFVEIFKDYYHSHSLPYYLKQGAGFMGGGSLPPPPPPLPSAQWDRNWETIHGLIEGGRSFLHHGMKIKHQKTSSAEETNIRSFDTSSLQKRVVDAMWKEVVDIAKKLAKEAQSTIPGALTAEQQAALKAKKDAQGGLDERLQEDLARVRAERRGPGSKDTWKGGGRRRIRRGRTGRRTRGRTGRRTRGRGRSARRTRGRGRSARRTRGRSRSARRGRRRTYRRRRR